MDEETYLKDCLKQLQEEYRQADKPIIDRLVEIEIVKPPSYSFTKEEWGKINETA